MTKKLLLVAAAIAAMSVATPSRAESVCVDAGASNPLGPSPITLPVVCVPVP